MALVSIAWTQVLLSGRQLLSSGKTVEVCGFSFWNIHIFLSLTGKWGHAGLLASCQSPGAPCAVSYLSPRWSLTVVKTRNLNSVGNCDHGATCVCWGMGIDATEVGDMGTWLFFMEWTWILGTCPAPIPNMSFPFYSGLWLCPNTMTCWIWQYPAHYGRSSSISHGQALKSLWWPAACQKLSF